MRLAPTTASAMPHASARVGCSRSQSAAIAHANTDLSDTSTTELATAVKRSDAIQDQKCSDRRRPARTINGSGERGAEPADAADGTAPRSPLLSHTANPP